MCSITAAAVRVRRFLNELYNYSRLGPEELPPWWCLRGSIICEFHVAAYISRLPAVNHHNGVLIMEIIARPVVVLSTEIGEEDVRGRTSDSTGQEGRTERTAACKLRRLEREEVNSSGFTWDSSSVQQCRVARGKPLHYVIHIISFCNSAP